MVSPVEYFFSWGNKFDVKTKADWDFWLLIIMFLAFATILFDNLYQFYLTQRFSNLGWAFVMLAILYFQYFGLKGAYEFRKMINAPSVKVESKEEMEKEFNELPKKTTN